MRQLRSQKRRRGAVMLETALVLPVLVAIVVGIIYSGLSVFKYQQMAALAREGARYASVHGAESGSVATKESIFTNAILPMAAGLDLTVDNITVTWSNSGKYAVYADTTSTPPGKAVETTVTVTVTYVWNGLTLTSTSTVPMLY